jgi:hypothetical protein
MKMGIQLHPPANLLLDKKFLMSTVTGTLISVLELLVRKNKPEFSVGPNSTLIQNHEILRCHRVQSKAPLYWHISRPMYIFCHKCKLKIITIPP